MTVEVAFCNCVMFTIQYQCIVGQIYGFVIGADFIDSRMFVTGSLYACGFFSRYFCWFQNNIVLSLYDPLISRQWLRKEIF